MGLQLEAKYWLNRLALSKSDVVAQANPLERTVDEFHGCSFLNVAQKALGSLLQLTNLMKNLSWLGEFG